MSVEVKDFRQHVERKAAEAAERDAKIPKPLLPQVEATTPSTGDDRLDKLNRILQVDIELCDTHLIEVATKGMGAANHDLLTVCQFEYMYTKGKVDALRAAQLVPYKILAEEKLTS
jgi:hypothetical protein